MTLSKVYPEMSRAFNSFSSTQKADSQSGWVRGKPTMTNPHHLSAASITSLKRDGNDSSSTSVGSAGSGSIARPNLKRKDNKSKKPAQRLKRSCSGFWARFSSMFFSRMFLRHRNIVFLLIEVLVPVAITCAIIAAFTSGISWKKSYYEKQDASDKTKLANKFHEVSMQEAMVNFSTRYTNNDGRIFILFTPVNSFTESIMARVRVLLLDERSLAKNPLETYPAATIKNGILGVETFEELIENTLIHRDETDAHGKPIGVVFHYNHKAIDPVTEVPYRLSFSIRHFEESISNTLDPYPYVKPRIATSPYIETGFIGLQYAIQYSYFQHLHQKIHSNKTVNLKSPTILTIDDAPVVKLHMFYFPNFYNVDVRTLITFVVCFCLVIAYLFTSFFILRQLVQENQSGIKEILNMHGMPTYLHWLILFVHALLFRGITAILMTLVLHTKFTFGKIISLSDTSLIFVLLWVHLLALTFFNFFLTTVIHSATFVGAYAILIGLVSFIAPTTFYKFGVIERVGNIILAFFFPNWALYNIFFYIINFDCDEKGVLWSNIKTKGQKGDTSYFTLFEGLLIMGASAIFYFLLATYINLTSQAKMFPPTLKWWDVIGRKKQWKENMSRQQELLIEIREGKDDNFEKPAIYEESNSGNKCYVRVRHLCKRFGKHKMALDTINMNIMHEEITVILGHGGSGKSTLVSILAGLLNPTAGYATIKNHDVIFEANKAGHFVGLCSQTLIYFNLLNVKQHLYLCYRLRGYVAADCTRNTSTLLTRLRLWNIRDYYPDSMTNEELRRLNIAMAMADSPKVLLLDEPTMGMDAFGRREIWNILKILKHHHTVILTSTYMDEAEYLADKIALLAHGRLICYGSVEFLKKQYDTGYFLKCSPFRDVKLDAQAILALVRNRVGENAEEQKNSTIKDVDNLIIELPIVDFLKFSELCEDFDRNQIKMGIKKYTFKQIGLNDIFIKICESISIDKDGPDLYVRRDSAGDVRSAMTSQIPTAPESGRYLPNYKSQFNALLQKRITYLLSKHDFLVWQFLIPICLILLVMYEAKIFAATPLVPPLRNMTFEPFSSDMQVFTLVSSDNDAINYTAHIKNTLGSRMKELSRSERILTALNNLLSGQTSNLGNVKENHMAALEFKSVVGNKEMFDFIGYFASGALHSAPVILNTMMNVILSAVTEPDKPKYQIFAVNNPLPLTTETWSTSHESCGLVCIIFSLILSFAFGFISGWTSIFPRQERRIGIKHMQFMSGVRPWLYWLGNFVCDATMMIIVTLIVGIIFYLDRKETFGTNAIFVLMCITVLYLGWSGLAFSYFVSCVLPMKFRGFTSMILIHMICLILFIFSEWVLKSTTSTGAVVLRFLLMIFPGFAVTCGIQDWFNAISRRSFCQGLLPHVKEMCVGSKEVSVRHFASAKHLYDHIMKTNVVLGQCCDKICKPRNACFKEPGILSPTFESWSNPGLITDLIALTLTGFLYWLLLLVAEKRIASRISQKVFSNFLDSEKGKKLRKTQVGSSDIKHETLVVKSMIDGESFPTDTAMIIYGLTKYRDDVILLNEFSLEVKKGDCIGILGAGGSGKSTLIRMIAGIDTPTKGMCYIGNASLVKNRKQYLSCLGYCPQENTLFDTFTGIQMLELMGRLRGIPKEILSSHVAKWLQVVGLSESGQDLCKLYGFDMKRRLCCAMALIGQCQILLLDEATTGIGPMGRERFWAVLEHLKDLGHTIIFTSFHTEECLKLSTKLVVLADGNAQCLGKPDDIQKRYARGYCLTFRMRHETLTRVDIVSSTMGKVVEFKKAVQQTFSYCDLLDEQDNLLMFFLRDAKIFWGEVFRRMHGLVAQYSHILSSYDVTEASIDELFVLLTNKYREMGTPRRIDNQSETEISKEEAEIQALEKAARALHMKV